MTIPDVVGAPLNDALRRLHQKGYQTVLTETLGKQGLSSDVIRVIRQKQVSEKTIELTISYF